MHHPNLRTFCRQNVWPKHSLVNGTEDCCWWCCCCQQRLQSDLSGQNINKLEYLQIVRTKWVKYKLPRFVQECRISDISQLQVSQFDSGLVLNYELDCNLKHQATVRSAYLWAKQTTLSGLWTLDINYWISTKHLILGGFSMLPNDLGHGVKLTFLVSNVLAKGDVEVWTKNGGNDLWETATKPRLVSVSQQPQ